MENYRQLPAKMHLKPATHFAILYADHRRIKSPISGLSNMGDYNVCCSCLRQQLKLYGKHTFISTSMNSISANELSITLFAFELTFNSINE